MGARAAMCPAVAIAVAFATDTHADINLPGDRIWWVWAALVAILPLAMTFPRRRRDQDGQGGGLVEVFASWV